MYQVSCYARIGIIFITHRKSVEYHNASLIVLEKLSVSVTNRIYSKPWMKNQSTEGFENAFGCRHH